MDREELKRALDEMGIDEREYSLTDFAEGDRMNIYQKGTGEWEVFFMEANKRQVNLRVHDSEHFACLDLYYRLKKGKETRETIKKMYPNKYK